MQKVAVVTGSRRGIGKGIADALKNEGYLVVYSARTEDSKLENYCPCDISDERDREALLQFACRFTGRVDLLVNNAGVACEKRLDILETTEESFDRLLRVNTKGTFFMCRLFARHMIEQKQRDAEYVPRIVNISSVSAYTSSVSRGEYCISKAGISMVTKLFADRLAEYGIPVFEVRPGIIATDMTECVKEKYDRMILEEGITPIRRWGTPEDVANCVLAAAGGLLDFGTGTVLNADGGFHIRRL